MSSPTYLSFRFPGFLLIALVFLLYSNTFHSPWILDDLHNIVNNPRIQITSLSLPSLKDALFSGGDSERLYRPLSCVSFALNAYFSEKNVFGYHLFNIGLHAINTIALLWLMIHVFTTPALKRIIDREKHFIIILATLLWAINPIQIQAVTYIVQRMAMLCAFFSILAFVFFIKARTADLRWKQFAFALCCGLAILCALFSKENGLIVLPLLLVLEFFLFQNGNIKNILSPTFFICLTAIIVISVLFFFYSTSLENLQNLYAKRSFTPYERLLTQPKVLLFYLSLIFYPLPQRFSLEHEVLISTGIFSPPLTIFYLTVIIAAFFFCAFYRKIPILIRMAGLFFITAHIVESSFLPLEMIFEHRNYLPSVFLFLPLAAGFYRLISHYDSHNKLLSGLLTAFVISLIFLISIATYTRNFDWRSGESIWLDAMEKAPGHARPKQSMGFAIGMQNPDKAIKFYSEGMEGYMHEPMEEKPSALTNIGLLFFHQQKYEQAQAFFLDALEVNNNYKIARYFLIQTYMKTGEWEKAISLNEMPQHLSAFQYLKGICFLRMGNHDQALEIFRNLYKNDRGNKNALLGIAESLSLGKHYQRAGFFYNYFMAQNPKKNDLEIAYIGMAKNSYWNNDIQKTVLFLEKFFRLAGVENAGAHVRMRKNDLLSPLSGLEEFIPFIENRFDIYKKNLQFN